MKRLICCLFLIAACICAKAKDPTILAKGQQPQVSVDEKGVIRVVFGRSDSVFCATSTNGGETFSRTDLVGIVPQMHLGMARGPQLASSTNYSMITAMDKNGDIHCFTLQHSKGQVWKKQGLVNDLRASAPEGLMNIAADEADDFYAVWLDTRIGKTNNVCFSSLSIKNGRWLKNKMVYQSPDGHVCECCRPSIAVQGNNVAIMYRNWLMGARDMYLISSADKGKTFGTGQKLGKGTWKLNACPMDGGGLVFNADHSITTTWKRQATVYTAKPGYAEEILADGRDCSLNLIDNGLVVSLSANGTVKFKNLNNHQEVTVGNGSYLKTIGLANHQVFCVWEQDGMIKTKKV
ncbi:hypothetical protein [Mucilaginibacter flavus]|uniref:hypothetical protein n=1 Tax=Mucilaginibacter flavus TaxID=931504 RepID=UPI0025B4F573|nr:hypothetical protein [Mucilaginibacter flavus]MDN3581626.1 hypothetical protein [Mucilaginibacter flavus]